MIQIKRLLPNELLARPWQRKETLEQAHTEGKLSLGERKEADWKKKKQLNEQIDFIHLNFSLFLLEGERDRREGGKKANLFAD